MIDSVFGLWSSVFLVLPELQLGVTVPGFKGTVSTVSGARPGKCAQV